MGLEDCTCMHVCIHECVRVCVWCMYVCVWAETHRMVGATQARVTELKAHVRYGTHRHGGLKECRWLSRKVTARMGGFCPE